MSNCRFARPRFSEFSDSVLNSGACNPTNIALTHK